jgi:colicin import membrane protein
VNTLAVLKKDDPFSRGIGVSIAFHLVILAVLALRAVFYPSEPMQFEHAIRVDMVGLPDKRAVLAPAPAAPAKEEAKPAENPAEKPVEKTPDKPKEPPKLVLKTDPDKIDLKKSQKEQSNALKRLEALRKLEAHRAQVAGKAASPAKAAPIRGNEVLAGTSLTGLSKIQHDGYLDQIDETIKSHWNLPRWLANVNLKAQVAIFIDANGTIVKKQIVRSSGNPVYDEKCMEAIERSSPLPPPPANLVNVFAVDGIVLGFPE